MQVTREDVSPCLASLEIEVEAGTWASAIQKARADLGKRTEVPGFRKGKAPMSVLERYLDAERVDKLAADYAMADALEEVVREQDLDLWDDPAVEVLTSSPEAGLKFKAVVQLSPRVELGQYVGLEIERIVRPVTDKVVDQEIERLRREHTSLEPKEEALVAEDYVFVAIQELDEEGSPKGEASHSAAVVGENVPDFDENITGLKPGESKRFDIHYPEDWSDTERAGSTVHVEVTISQAYRQVKPELTDEFAKTVGDYESLDVLKSEIRASAERAFAQLADDQVQDDILRKIVEGSRVDYPPQLLQRETARRVRDTFHELEHRQRTFEQYLEEMKITEDQFREILQARSDRDIRVGLILAEIGSKEDIQVSDEEIDEQVEGFRSAQTEQSDEILDFVESDSGRAAIARRRRTAKVLDFLRAASNIKDVMREDGPEEETDEKQEV